jgi:hypothetical protein
LFIVHGALFENFLIANKGEKDFFEKKVLPSFMEVAKYFGVKPLIFPLLPLSDENQEEWFYYKKDLEEVL